MRTTEAMAERTGASRPVPSPRQLRWHELEVYGFLHFTVNTFTGKEWGYGDESPFLFQPTDFDADAIVEAAASGGLRGLILTCKHHDGFCLWPSRTTDHSVRRTPWRSGRGDIVREVSEACARRGLGFGVYLSPWDRNHPDYGRPGYLRAHRDQLRELLGDYGPLFEVWFDGANGGDGYYGGARETRRIDKTTYYGWERTWELVREMQPDACIFSDAGPDVRWVGNEKGIAGDPCWATLDTEGFMPGEADRERLNRGDREGGIWLPAECDVSIRPGWFYHAEEDGRVKSPLELLDLYYRSVGRGASLLLNLPPDPRGRIHERDAESLAGFRRLVDRTFGANLARAARPEASGILPLLDGNPHTFWRAPEGPSPVSVEIPLRSPVRFNVIGLREYLPLGQRMDSFTIAAGMDGRWVEIARGTSVGSRRLARTRTVETDRVRLNLTAAGETPVLSEFALYLEENLPESGSDPDAGAS
jgi:alpha-L-fucosidase